MPIQFMSICDGGNARDVHGVLASMASGAQRQQTDAASPYRLLDVLGAVAHLELAEIPLDLSEDVVLAEILVVDLRASIFMPRRNTRSSSDAEAVTLILSSLLIGLSTLNVNLQDAVGAI